MWRRKRGISLSNHKYIQTFMHLFITVPKIKLNWDKVFESRHLPQLDSSRAWKHKNYPKDICLVKIVIKLYFSL